MKKKFKLGIIGAGFMSTAILDGVFTSKLLDKSDIIVSAKHQVSLDKISCKGVKTTLDNKYLAENSEYLLFAVKPQNFVEVAEEIKTSNIEKIISIMAGVKKDKIKKFFPNAKVARAMPNTPCSINCGAVGLDISDFNNEDDKKFIYSIFDSVSLVKVVDEKYINAVIGVSGSAPAYFYYFIKAIIDSGVKNGLSKEDAKDLAVETMLGSANMLKTNKNVDIDSLINAVCCKGGTTIEAIKTFNDNNLDKIIVKGVDACIKRAEEIEKQ